MPNGLHISAAGANIQSLRLQVLSNNLANVATPGFKREFAVFQNVNLEAKRFGPDSHDAKLSEQLGGLASMQETVTDFTRGTLQQTGNPADLAIDGPGFFMVSRNGENLLTKAGNFHVAPDGRVLTEQGYAVLSQDRRPLTINPNLPFEFLQQGAISQAGGQIPLALVEPESLRLLVKQGENLFSTPDGTELNDIAPENRHVASGFIEQSSVQPALEMMELIETTRAYETNVRMIQNQDQLLSSLLNRVLRV